MSDPAPILVILKELTLRIMKATPHLSDGRWAPSGMLGDFEARGRDPKMRESIERLMWKRKGVWEALHHLETAFLNADLWTGLRGNTR